MRASAVAAFVLLHACALSVRPGGDAGVDAGEIAFDAHDERTDARDVPDAPDAPPPPPDAPPPPFDPHTACSQGLNLGQPPIDGCFTGAWLAWEYTPAQSIQVASLALHTPEADVAVLEPRGSQPGAVLARGHLGAAAPDGWRTATLAPSVALYAGRRYFIAVNATRCSEVQSGVQPTYWAVTGPSGSLESGPWDGPFVWHAYTMRLAGLCE